MMTMTKAHQSFQKKLEWELKKVSFKFNAISFLHSTFGWLVKFPFCHLAAGDRQNLVWFAKIIEAPKDLESQNRWKVVEKKEILDHFTCLFNAKK